AQAGTTEAADLRALMDAADSWTPTEPIPALASQALRDLDFDEGTRVYAGRVYVTVEFIGTATTVPDGWVEGPYVIVPLDPFLATEFEAPVETAVTFLLGADAVQAAVAAGVDERDITTRDGWLSGVRESALVGGVERMMAL